MTYFISDLHFCHKNILKFNKCGNDSWRNCGYTVYDETENFISVEEYNTFIVDRWNSIIKKDDRVFIIGDTGLGNNSDIISYLNKLNGSFLIIKGNHDPAEVLDQFPYSKDSIYELPEKNITLCHYPIFDFKNAKKGVTLLFGHIHNGYELNTTYASVINSLSRFYNTDIKAFNVGACCPWMNYTPKTVEQIEKDYKYFIAHKTNRR